MSTSSPPKWPWWPWAVLTAAGVTITVIAAIVGTATNANSGEAEQPAPRVTVTATVFDTTTVKVTVTVPPPPDEPARALLDGNHRVGVEVQPGIYQTTGPSGTNEGGCYWTRTDSGGRLIDNGVINGPGTLTIAENEQIETEGCQPWQKVD